MALHQGVEQPPDHVVPARGLAAGQDDADAQRPRGGIVVAQGLAGGRGGAGKRDGAAPVRAGEGGLDLVGPGAVGRGGGDVLQVEAAGRGWRWGGGGGWGGGWGWGGGRAQGALAGRVGPPAGAVRIGGWRHFRPTRGRDRLERFPALGMSIARPADGPHAAPARADQAVGA